MQPLTVLTLAGALAVTAIAGATTTRPMQAAEKKTMELGNFSISLAVKDVKASKAFYEKLDFKEVGGKLEQNWIILQNGTTTIGLFQGMFQGNLMTFNPGWTKDQETLKDFQDVRELQKALKARGIALTTEADESTDGPASFTMVDPDGNAILVDQHVPRPKR
jgi:catechol 2,3-dioxygenase-like lactoylglutathione lyase family enzyme